MLAQEAAEALHDGQRVVQGLALQRAQLGTAADVQDAAAKKSLGIQ